MPIIHSKLDLTDVNEVLRRRGYAFHSQRGVGLRLTKGSKTERFKQTGRSKRMLLIALSPSQLDEILTYSRNADEAANQIEQISLGYQERPEWDHPGAPRQDQGSAGGLTDQQLAKLVENRVQNELEKLSRQHALDVARHQDKIEELEARINATTPGKKTGKKRAAVSKNEPRKLDAEGLPILNEEEQAALDAIMDGAARSLRE